MHDIDLSEWKDYVDSTIERNESLIKQYRKELKAWRAKVENAPKPVSNVMVRDYSALSFLGEKPNYPNIKEPTIEEFLTLKANDL